MWHVKYIIHVAWMIHIGMSAMSRRIELSVFYEVSELPQQIPTEIQDHMPPTDCNKCDDSREKLTCQINVSNNINSSKAFQV